MADEKLYFTENLVDFVHKTAVYYEDKKHKFLTMAIALLGFGATFMKVFQNEPLMIIASIFLLLFSLFSILAYVFSSYLSPKVKIGRSLRLAEHNIDPRRTVEQNYKNYRNKLASLTAKDLVDENISEVVTLFYMYQNKIRAIKNMSVLLTIGIIGFILIVVYHGLSIL